MATLASETTPTLPASTSQQQQQQQHEEHKNDAIFDLLKENKLEEAFEYVRSGQLTLVDCVDEHGTTPLQYAAFRGLVDMCRVLMERGADVNAKTHDQGYSALMFAAISNHQPVVSLLLEHEADVDYTNTIGRTAAQMAGFVSAHESVDLINSYVSKQALDYYTEIRGVSEKEPKLPKGECLDELHKLLTSSSNYAPIRVLKAIKASKNNTLVLNVERIVLTLDAFCTRAFKDEENTCPNDILAFRLHYFKYLCEFVTRTRKSVAQKMDTLGQQQQQQQTKPDPADVDTKAFDICCKQLVSEEEVLLQADNDSDKKTTIKCRVFEDKFLRESIRQFPYKECALVRQMVTVLAKTPIGHGPSALYVITSCLNGQRFNMDDSASSSSSEAFDPTSKKHWLECATCTQKSATVKWCSHCKKLAYCDQFCQRLHWPIHKNQRFDI